MSSATSGENMRSRVTTKRTERVIQSTTNNTEQDPASTNIQSACTLTPNATGTRRSSMANQPSRVREKEELVNLNDRLAAYIEKVRKLETENTQLKDVVQVCTTSQEKEVKKITSMYALELDEVRKVLDDVSRDRARLEIEVTKQRSVSNEMTNKYKAAAAELAELKQQVAELDAEMTELKVRAEVHSGEIGRRDASFAKCESAIAHLEKQLSRVRKQLEDETLVRVDFENKNLTLREEIDFLKQANSEDVERYKRAAVEISTLRNQIENAHHECYDQLMPERLQEIRDETEQKIEEMRQEVESAYSSRAQELQDKFDRLLLQEQEMRAEVDYCRKRVGEVCQERDEANRRIVQKEDHINDLERRFAARENYLNKTISDLEKKMTDLRRDYDNLNTQHNSVLDTMVTLDQEIETYRKLVEAEETRLSISGTNADLSSGRKRKRCDNDDVEIVKSMHREHFETSSSNEGPMEIVDEDDTTGHFVAVRNTSAKQVSVGGWVLSKSVNGGEKKIEYKFSRGTTVGAGDSVTVYSSSSQVEAAVVAATNEGASGFVVMPKGKDWPVGKQSRTTLTDLDGNLVAHREAVLDVKQESNKIKGFASRLFGI